MKYNPQIVAQVLKQQGIPKPVFELKFHPTRKWRFDLAWPDQKVALEVQGGIWTGGRHNRPAAMLKEWEKLNTAAGMGWRMLYCQPSDLLMDTNIQQIRTALDYSPNTLDVM